MSLCVGSPLQKLIDDALYGGVPERKLKRNGKTII